MQKEYINMLKQAIQARYEQKFGPVELDYEEFVPETDIIVRLRYSVSKAGHFLKRHAGRAVYTDSNNDKKHYLYLERHATW